MVESFLATSGRGSYALHSIAIVANSWLGLHCQVSLIFDYFIIMIVLSHGVFVMTPQLSAVVVIALAFSVDQMVFESVADSTVLRLITLLLPFRSLQ